MDFAAFVIDAETHYLGHAMTLRRGQAYFNKLVDLDSALADRIRGGLDDPFYDNAVLPRFLYRVDKEWDNA